MCAGKGYGEQEVTGARTPTYPMRRCKVGCKKRRQIKSVTKGRDTQLEKDKKKSVTAADNFEEEHQEHQRQLKVSMTMEKLRTAGIPDKFFHTMQTFLPLPYFASVSSMNGIRVYRTFSSSSEYSCVKSPALQGQSRGHTFSLSPWFL
jgi:hypothetical protein